MPKQCAAPKATKRVINWGAGPMAWCVGCNQRMPAAQVPWGQELRNGTGAIVATFAPIAH